MLPALRYGVLCMNLVWNTHCARPKCLFQLTGIISVMLVGYTPQIGPLVRRTGWFALNVACDGSGDEFSHKREIGVLCKDGGEDSDMLLG